MNLLRTSSAGFLATFLTAALGIASPGGMAGGSIAGKVTLQGQAPKSKSINMSSEPGCAKQYSTPPSTEEVVVGPGGGLKNVVIYISAGTSEEAAPAPEPVSLTQKGCRFGPHVVALQTNQEVRVVNEDATTHNIHPLATVNREWNKAQPPGTPPIEETFAREEVISVKCNIHSWMHSYFVVLKTRHYSVSNENGAFSLENLPPGKYTITAWHELYGKQTQEVTITGNEMQPLNFTFKAN